MPTSFPPRDLEMLLFGGINYDMLKRKKKGRKNGGAAPYHPLLSPKKDSYHSTEKWTFLRSARRARGEKEAENPVYWKKSSD